MASLPIRTALLKLLFVLLALALVPWALHMPSDGLDESWFVVISHAFVNRWQFGKDIVFTLGPYGFVHTSLFHPETYRFTLALWSTLLIAVAYGASCFITTHRLAGAYL